MEVIRLLDRFSKMPGVGHLALVGGVSILSAILRYYLRKRGYEGAAYVLDRITYVVGGFVTVDLILKFGRYALAAFGIY